MRPRIVSKRAARVIDSTTIHLYEDGEHVRTIIVEDGTAVRVIREWLTFETEREAS
jgi:hypothetical protein